MRISSSRREKKFTQVPLFSSTLYGPNPTLSVSELYEFPSYTTPFSCFSNFVCYLLPIMELFNLMGQGTQTKMETLLGTPSNGNTVPTQPPTPPAFTEEQQQEVLKFLDQLDEQKENDPEAYLKNLRALGLIPEGVEPTPEAMNSMSGLAEAIGSMRSSVASTPTMAVNLPGGKSMLGKEGIEAVQQTPGITITPEPGFTVKTKVLPDGPKVFLNLCTHTNLGEPTMKKRLNDEGEPVEGMNVPVSVGPVHKEQDKNGTECLVFDMIVNPKVLEDANEDETGQQRDFLCHLAMQSVEQKNTNMMFDRRYKLPKLKYMGAKIHSQHIRDSRATPKIEEVNGSSSSSSSSSSKKTTIGSRLGKTPSAVNTVVVEPDKDLPFHVSWIKQRIGSDDSLVHHVDNGDSSESIPVVSSLPPSISLPFGTYETPWESTNLTGSDYTEPILVPDDDVVGIALLVDLTGTSSSHLQPHQIEVRLSPFKLHIKIHGYKPVSLYFPCAVLPPSATSSLQRPEGNQSKHVPFSTHPLTHHYCIANTSSSYPLIDDCKDIFIDWNIACMCKLIGCLGMLRQMRVANHGMSLSFFLLSYRVLFVVSTPSLLTHTYTYTLRPIYVVSITTIG